MTQLREYVLSLVNSAVRVSLKRFWASRAFALRHIQPFLGDLGDNYGWWKVGIVERRPNGFRKGGHKFAGLAVGHVLVPLVPLEATTGFRSLGVGFSHDSLLFASSTRHMNEFMGITVSSSRTDDAEIRVRHKSSLALGASHEA